MKRVSLPRSLVVLTTLLALVIGQETWALAGVTGNIAGTIKDSSGAPVAGVQVQAVSASQSSTATTDAGGHFVILSLNPDTYTVSVSKSGYQSTSYPGVVVFADQTQQVAYTMAKALRTIAHVTSQAGTSLVKSGVGSDLYSVNANQASAAAALGGGGNLNNAYSAMASVPGVQTSQGGIGWDFNAAYVRGQNSYYTGFEYDGIPINRAFDNYNAGTESSLGLQELQVYTGGGPSSVASAGTAGFINQVIKTGTFPGFATANLGISTPNYYHQAQVEIGGSTPDRTFSYYIGLLGYNQTYRFIDNTNGAGYGTPGGIFSGNTNGFGTGYGFGSLQLLDLGFMCLSGTCQGVKPVCPLVTAGISKFSFPAQGCWQYYSATPLRDGPFMVSDRENVINLHMGIPKANGLRDDVQLMWSGSALSNSGYTSPTDLGPGNNQFVYSQYNTLARMPHCGPDAIGPGLTVNGCNNPGQFNGTPFCGISSNQFGNCGQITSLASAFQCGVSPPSAPSLGCSYTYMPYADNVAYNVPFGSVIAKNATTIKAPGVYIAPGTPSHTFGGPIGINDDSVNQNQNDAGITKLQYTYALSQSAYLRAYGYTFYSDWYLTDPAFGSCDELCPSFPEAAQYQLITHTSGGALDFQDQLNDQNLVSLDGNYTTAGVIRFNNSSAYAGCAPGFFNYPNACSPIGYMSGSGSNFTCYDPTSGAKQVCLNSSYYDVATKSTRQPDLARQRGIGSDGVRRCGALRPGRPGQPGIVSGAETRPARKTPFGRASSTQRCKISSVPATSS